MAYYFLLFTFFLSSNSVRFHSCSRQHESTLHKDHESSHPREASLLSHRIRIRIARGRAEVSGHFCLRLRRASIFGHRAKKLLIMATHRTGDDDYFAWLGH